MGRRTRWELVGHRDGCHSLVAPLNLSAGRTDRLYIASPEGDVIVEIRVRTPRGGARRPDPTPTVVIDEPFEATPEIIQRAFPTEGK